MNSLYDIDTDSDSNESEDQQNKEGNSSDEEMEKEFNAFFKAKSISYKPKPEKKDLADDFEDEMNQEIINVIKTNQEKCKVILENENENLSVKMSDENKDCEKNETRTTKIEEDEEDTDSEAEFATGVRTTKKRQKFTNDELFYDPNMDEEDENWINKQRKTSKKVVTPGKQQAQLNSILKSTAAQSSVKTEENLNSKESKITYVNAHTDAILNCPCCMTTLCMDCQRHEKYRTQYRAMFVSNCKINEEEQLKYPKEEFDSLALNSKKFKKNKLKFLKEEPDQIPKDFDIFKPVMCNICCAEVGVYEVKEEIYHFFNVITSHS